MLTIVPQEAPISLGHHFVLLARTLILVDAGNG